MSRGRGGRRDGAGRPKGSRGQRAKQSIPFHPSDTQYPSAEAYLDSVVAGIEPPDPARIAAAKAILPYQRGKERAPVKSASPRQLELKVNSKNDGDERAAWLAKSAEVRARLKNLS
ncbi:MAG: hypothetical protein O2971_16605 [Proteobacteria bacterium]|nr:hypothetical protein [Pseudomonadota bacterium]